MRAEISRQRVVELCRELAQRGYFAATGGNIALRIDAELLAVTPSATDYYVMCADDVSVVRMSDLRQIEGACPPSVESSLHARVLRARPDCYCSIHTHQPIASACTLLGQPLTVDTAERQRLLGPVVPMVGYAPSGTRWLASKLAKAVRPTLNAYLMRNHGVLCCGPDIATAVQALAALESLAADHLRRHILARAAADPSRRHTLQGVLDALARSFDAHSSPSAP
jgi:L-fuculose-phosphate aldolase